MWQYVIICTHQTLKPSLNQKWLYLLNHDRRRQKLACSQCSLFRKEFKKKQKKLLIFQKHTKPASHCVLVMNAFDCIITPVKTVSVFTKVHFLILEEKTRNNNNTWHILAGRLYFSSEASLVGSVCIQSSSKWYTTQHIGNAFLCIDSSPPASLMLYVYSHH